MSQLDTLFPDTLRVPAECEIRVDGLNIGKIGLNPLLREVSVDVARAEAATATLTFDTRRNEQGLWDVQDKNLIVPWARVEIDAVFGSEKQPVFHGYVRETRGEYPAERGSATFTVTCQDVSMLLDREQRRKQHAREDRPRSDQQILAEILKQSGLRACIDNDPGMSGITQLNQDDTDIRLLRKRAEANGYELIFYPGDEGCDFVYFGRMRLSATPQPTIMVYAGPASHAAQVSVREDAMQPDRIVVQFADRENDRAVTEEPRPETEVLGRERLTSENRGLPSFVRQLSGEAGDDQTVLGIRARAQSAEADLRRVVAEGELDGSTYGHVLQVGLPVGLDGVGDRHSGIYYVDRVTHVFDASGYRQQFTLLRNAVGDNL